MLLLASCRQHTIGFCVLNTLITYILAFFSNVYFFTLAQMSEEEDKITEISTGEKQAKTIVTESIVETTNAATAREEGTFAL